MDPSVTLMQAMSMLKSGTLSLNEMSRHVLRQIESWEPHVQAFLHIDYDYIKSIATDSLVGPLAGIPIGVKDLINVMKMPTTGGSQSYNWVPSEDAYVVEKLRAAGAMIVGKTNTHELAYGVVTPPTCNPWNLNHIPGGSSGGSAVSVATGMALGALGTDTGGSVRIPASCCGVVGFKPSVGRVSKHGVMPLSTTFDHIGVMARTVPDTRYLIRLIEGFNPNGPRSIMPPKFRLQRPRSRRLGIPWAYLEKRISPEIKEAFNRAVKVFQSLGWEVEDIEMEPWEYWKDLQMNIRLPEAYHYHQAVLEGSKRQLLKGDLAERLDPGKDMSALAYISAQEKRLLAIQSWSHRLEEFDALLMPTLLCSVPRVGEESIPVNGLTIPIWEALVYSTAPWNVLGFPAISVPCGMDSSGLPMGLQIIGFPYEDDQVLDLAEQYEMKVGPWQSPLIPDYLPVSKYAD
jgi:aspartyl-tRNA(Asn)/glutamyl-tRNA(Gln) amidotransferase subunit A